MKKNNRLSFLLFAVILISCKKDEVKKSEIYSQLTKTWWKFYLNPPGTIGLPNSGYGIYHVPANIGAYSISGHSILLKDNSISFSPDRSSISYSWELQNNLRDIKVNKSVQGGSSSNEIWVITEISDTLLNLRIRDASEPESTENYWGFKYRRP